MKQYYECGICSCFHPIEWDADCRDDANRFAMDELDEKHKGEWSWVDMPGTKYDSNTTLTGSLL
jgi:hypothetical protein